MYFHLAFMTRGWLYKMANHYCFQTKLGEEERETAELDCPWPMTNRQLSCHLCFGHLSSCRKYIWNETPYSAEAQSSPWIFFFSLPGKKIGLRRGKGEGKSIKQIPKRTVSTFPWVRLTYQLENLSLDEAVPGVKALDAGFKHAHSSSTYGSRAQIQNLLHSRVQEGEEGENKILVLPDGLYWDHRRIQEGQG